MKHSDIQKMKLPLCPKCETQMVLYKRGDSFFEYCEKCKEGDLIAFCTEYDNKISTPSYRIKKLYFTKYKEYLKSYTLESRRT